jgi:hypothetical protein
VRDYKRHLKAVQRWKPASVNLALAALDSFYTQLGLGRPVVRREELPASAPRALAEEQQRRLLRMAERASARDRAIVVILLYTGLRLAELVALDVEDVPTSARKGLVVVRSGKGDAYREVPLNALVRQVLEEWLAERKRLAADTERAVFVGRGGRRLAKRSVDDVVRGLGEDAGGSRSSPLARALQEYGRLVKTNFVLAWLGDEELRRRIGRQLNKGEQLHALRRVIFYANEGHVRQRTPEQQTEQALCLSIVVNAIVAWNTVYIQRVLDELLAAGELITTSETERISPLAHQHIHLYGHYPFDLATRADGHRPLRAAVPAAPAPKTLNRV